MKAPIKLYVDKIYNEGSNGETFDAAKIYYNLEKINKGWFDEFVNSFSTHNATSATMPAGRFIVIISMTFDRSQQAMILMDFHNDAEFAKKIVSQRESAREREMVMGTFHSMAEMYEEDFDKFVLVEGSLPTESK